MYDLAKKINKNLSNPLIIGSLYVVFCFMYKGEGGSLTPLRSLVNEPTYYCTDSAYEWKEYSIDVHKHKKLRLQKFVRFLSVHKYLLSGRYFESYIPICRSILLSANSSSEGIATSVTYIVRIREQTK